MNKTALESGLNLPNAMTPGAWILVAVVVAAILAGFAFLFWAWWNSRVKWLPLDGFRQGAVYFSKAPGLDVLFLATALNKAEDLLAKHAKWSPAEIAQVASGIHVYVHAGDEWVDLWGRKVAGQQIGHAVAVGRNLAALLHETAHLCEELIDGEIDLAHASWKADGIEAAVAAFDSWLKGRR